MAVIPGVVNHYLDSGFSQPLRAPSTPGAQVSDTWAKETSYYSEFYGA